MNGVDVLILLWILIAALRGMRIGFLRQAFSFVGFFTGLFAGSWISPALASMLGNSFLRAMVPLFATFILAFSFAGLLEMIGARLQSRFRLRFAHTLNSTLGITFGVVSVLIASWLIGAALSRLPLATAGLRINNSVLFQSMEDIMPPAPTVIERLGRLLSPHGFPEVFVGREPETDPAGPPSTPEVEMAAAAARNSVVRIESEACGGIAVGTGFIVAPGFVATNAHVVAGVRQPIIYDENGRRVGTVVWFNPDADFAVIRTSGLEGPVLPLSDEYAERGSSGAVLGYPGGGDLRVSPAVVLRRHDAIGRDIYHRDISAREIYEIDSNIQQGNSGGPLVLPDGSVAGVIFASAVQRESIGYALTAQEIADDLARAVEQNRPVSTGSCVL